MSKIQLCETIQNKSKTSTQARPNFVFIPLNEGKPSQKGYLGKTNNFQMVYRVVHTKAPRGNCGRNFHCRSNCGRIAGAIFIAGQIAGVIAGTIFITRQIAPAITPKITANFAPGGFRKSINSCLVQK